MKIVSYNVAGLRAMLKKPIFEEYILNEENNISILCIQETKAQEEQVQLSDKIKSKYVYRYWNSTKGTTQRKGLSGVSIWSTLPPISNMKNPLWDEEGRILTLEFEEFILITLYVPNSQKLECNRYYFREKWNAKFITYIGELKEQFKNKEIIICGDLNVAHLNFDICKPKEKKNKVAGFFDNERRDFSCLLETLNLTDIYRALHNNTQKSTYWSNFLKSARTLKNGWGIDYFICSSNFMESGKVKECNILLHIKGSDHCPIELIIN